jgi:hypothetical protein
MKDFLDFLFTEAPWIRTLIAWGIGLIILFLVVTVPAHFVLWPFFRRVRQELAEFIGKVRKKLSETRAERGQRLNSHVDELLTDGGLWRLKDEAAGKWTALTVGLSRTFEKMRRQLGRIGDSLRSLDNRIGTLQERIQQSEIDQIHALPSLPEAQELSESEGELRVAKMRLILASTILLGLMTVNTGMLSQILRDLGVVPSTISFLGLPLAYVLAFLLTLAEAGIGAAHGMSKKRKADSETISLWPVVWTILALTVACVEGFFYSRIAPSGAKFAVPFLGYEMNQSDLFFLWGFALVTTLFGLGLMAYESFDTVRRGNPRVELQRAIERLRREHDRYAGAVKGSKEALNQTMTAASNANTAIHGAGSNVESVRDEIDRISKQLTKISGAVPQWAQDKESALTRTEVDHFTQMGGLWFCFTLLGMGVISITGLFAYEAFYPNLPPLMLWVLAVGQAFLFLAVGLLLGVGETVVQGRDTERKVWAAPRFTRWLASLMGGLLLVVYAILFLMVAWPIALGGVWFLNILMGLFLIACGYQLGPLMNMLRLWFKRVWNVFLIVLEEAWLGFVKLFHFFFVILENVAYLFALPLERILHGQRGQGDGRTSGGGAI